MVEDSINFEKLHKIVQEIMGRKNYHLWEFKINGISIIPPDEKGEFNLAESSFNKLFNSPEFLKMFEKNNNRENISLDINKVNEILQKVTKEDERKEKLDIQTPINKLINGRVSKFFYRYDFGDDWQHLIVIEKVFKNDKNQKYPVCICGKNA